MPDRPLNRASIERLKRKLAAIPQEVKDAAHQTLLTGAQEMVAQMKSGAPVDDGELRDSIELIDESGDQWIARVKVVAGGKKTTKPVRKSKKGNAPTYDYARALEYGTAHAEAKPFFRPVVDRYRKRIRSRVGRAIKKSLKGLADD